jgi:hypothetical protein
MSPFAALLLLALPIASAADTPSPLACPVTLPGQGGTREFERINIYNGKPGGEEYDLAPDRESQTAGRITQTWLLENYRSMDIFIRCRYHRTDAVKTLDVPAKYQKCTFTFQLDKQHKISGKSVFSCE